MQDVKTSKADKVDKLLGRFLKDSADILAKPVSNASKITKLKPIFKRGTKTDPSNYKSISLLLVISKIIEKVVHVHTNAFLSDENILYNY